MINAVVWGINGKMGGWVYDSIINSSDFFYAGGVDKDIKDKPNTFADAERITGKVDVVIDFSHPSSLNKILDFVQKKNCALVLATTGYSKEELDRISDFAKSHPVFLSGNMSIGVNLSCELARLAAKKLGLKYDVEIIEKHHNLKVDSPSGTALMLEKSIRSSDIPYGETLFGRNGAIGARKQGEIGIHAVRGGTIVGEHTVIFAGADEIIEIKHTALSRRIFADGTLEAGRFIIAKTSGLFSKV